MKNVFCLIFTLMLSFSSLSAREKNDFRWPFMLGSDDNMELFFETWKASQYQQNANENWIIVNSPGFDHRCPDSSDGEKIRLVKGNLEIRNKKFSELDLFKEAINCQLTSGKWLIYPEHEHVDKVWKAIASSVHKGILGTHAKISILRHENESKGQVICLYTSDFRKIDELKEVKRLLEKDLNILPFLKNGKNEKKHGFFYKLDFFTELGIYDDKNYGLKNSFTMEEIERIVLQINKKHWYDFLKKKSE